MLPDSIRTIPDAEDLNFYIREALFRKTEIIGDGFGDIEHTAGDEWPPIVDTDFGAPAIFEIRHADDAGDGKCLMSCDTGPWPEILTGGCLAGKDQKMFGVMGCHTGFQVAECLAGLNRMITDTADRVRLGFIASDIRAKAAGERQAE